MKHVLSSASSGECVNDTYLGRKELDLEIRYLFQSNLVLSGSGALHCIMLRRRIVIKVMVSKSKTLYEKRLLVVGGRRVVSFLTPGWPHMWSKSRWKREWKTLSCGKYIFNRGWVWEKEVRSLLSMLLYVRRMPSFHTILEQKSP